MSSDFRSALVLMCRRVLHPLIRILVRFGVSAGELKAIVDSVYAQAGAEYLQGNDERVTYSRLAVITGINRTFLPAVMNAPQDQFLPRSNTQQHRSARVLTGWFDDENFQTRAGDPAVLAIDGRGHTFRLLAERYSGGIYHQTVLSELIRSGAVKPVGRNRVRALRRTPMAEGASADSVYAAADTAGDVLSTLEHNLTAAPNEQLPVGKFVAAADPESLPLFRAQLWKRADGLLEVVDSFLQSHGPDPNASDAAGRRGVEIGAAVIAIHRPPPAAPVARPGHKRRR
ncbi:MAG TPA: DUF6502 family protein [Steroidobacteraceae bacterium]|nr:DUF6502 family protein [Steroidobacteraceae bacterium]